MCGWCGSDAGFLCGWWWLIPVAAMILCFSFCFFFRRQHGGGRFCCWGGGRIDEPGSLKREIRELREEIDRIKEK